MRLIARAKINWTLAVRAKRADGYHALDMLMQSVELADVLEITEAETLALCVTGDAAVPTGGENIVMRAAEALRGLTGTRRGARILLEKHIPVGAGLGGGSADAAAALQGLCRLWNLELPAETLTRAALALGADVPFCLRGGLARAQGIGERLTPLLTPRSVDVVIVKPAQSLSTPAVFAAYDARGDRPPPPDAVAAAAALLAGNLSALSKAMGNALGPAAAALCPEIPRCVAALKALGALGAQVTGSGSAVIGLFDAPKTAARAALACGRLGYSVHTRTV